MLRPLVLLAVIVALAIGAAAQPVVAQEEIDISGSWRINFVDLFDSSCDAVIEQDSEELRAAAMCPLFGTLTFEGTIDPVTGAFNLSSGGISFEGHVLPDGDSLTGTWTFHFYRSTGSLTGERIDDIELVDISGVWDVVFLDDISNICALDIEQGLVSLSAILDCGKLGVTTLEGTIDPFDGSLSLRPNGDMQPDFFGVTSPDASHITGFVVSFDFSRPSSPVFTFRSFVAVPAGALERGIVLVGCRMQNMFGLFCNRIPGRQASNVISVELAVAVAPAGGYAGIEATLSWSEPLAFGEMMPSDQCATIAADTTALSLSLTCTFADQSDFAGDLLSFTLTCPENTGDTVLEFDGASFIGAEPDLGPPTLIGAQATCLDAAFVEPPRLLGDADCSEAVTSIDAAFILQFVARLLESLACQTAGDTNEDGVIDSIDAVLILQNVAGLL